MSILPNVNRSTSPQSRPTAQPTRRLASRLVRALVVMLVIAAVAFAAWVLIKPPARPERFQVADAAYTFQHAD